MNTEELFINIKELPNPLDKTEVYRLLIEISEGSEVAKEKLVCHNTRLVLNEVVKTFSTVNYDKRELVAIGNLGLLKAVNSFDISKNVEFSTYAVKCIDNEIQLFLRKLKKDANLVSINKVVDSDIEGNLIVLEDILSCEDVELEKCINSEINIYIKEFLESLSLRDREVIMMYFGFYDDKVFTQREIAKKFNVSQSFLSRLIGKIINQLGKYLEVRGIIDKRTKVKLTKKKMNKKIKNIYQLFDVYTKEQVNEVLLTLTEEEMQVMKLRYGDDLENSVSSSDWNIEYSNLLYNIIIPKMKRILDSNNNARKVKGTNLIELENVEQVKFEIGLRNFLSGKLINCDVISSQDYERLLEILSEMVNFDCFEKLNATEVMVILLKFGYIDGKSFSTSVIANFLEIPEVMVLETLKKILNNYREKINLFIEEICQLNGEEAAMNIKMMILQLR